MIKRHQRLLFHIVLRQLSFRIFPQEFFMESENIVVTQMSQIPHIVDLFRRQSTMLLAHFRSLGRASLHSDQLLFD